MGLEELRLVSKLTEDLTKRQKQFELSFATIDGYTFKFQNFCIEADESIDNRTREENLKICKVSPTKQSKDADQLPIANANLPMYVTEVNGPGKHFVGKTLAEVEAECNREDFCWRVTNVCLELFGRGTYSV